MLLASQHVFSLSKTCFSDNIRQQHIKAAHCVLLCHVVLCNILQGLPQPEPAIMDKLLWPSVPMLTSVHHQEEVARRTRDALSGCILASLTPLRR